MTAEIKNAVITSTKLTIEDHGVLSAWLYLDYGNLSQGFGGHCLATNPDRKSSEMKTTFCGDYIWRILEIAGVTSWEDLPGCSIRVKAEHTGIKAIGHYLKDDWFDPLESFQKNH